MNKKRKLNQDLVQRTPLALRSRQVFRFVANDHHKENVMNKELEDLFDPDIMHLVGIEKVGKKPRLKESEEVEESKQSEEEVEEIEEVEDS